MRTYRTGLLMIATAGLLAAAPPAHADTRYGGTGNSGPQSVGPPLSLVCHDDGRIGTLTPDTVTGTLKEGRNGCPNSSFPIMLHSESAPAGAPAVPALSAQSTGGVRLPVALRTSQNGKVLAYWLASMRCGPKAVVPLYNRSPTAPIKPDGTFGRSEAFTVKYSDGSSERFRVSFKGRVLADGAVGTLRARSQLRKKGKRYYPCDSGTQTWAARP